MNTPSSHSDSDDFRVVDLFSPGADSGRPVSERKSAADPSRMATSDLPASFLFTNPLFDRPGSTSDPKSV